MVIMLLCLAVAYVRLMRSDRGALGGADRWLVALPVGRVFSEQNRARRRWVRVALAKQMCRLRRLEVRATACGSGIVGGNEVPEENAVTRPCSL